MPGDYFPPGVDSMRRGLIMAGATAPLWLPDAARDLMADVRPSGVAHPPKDGIALTIVYDNYAGPPDLLAKWGFSCWIDGLEKIILFDTGGEGPAMLANMRHLQLDPQRIDAVVLSHSHGDHVGGLASLAGARKGRPVYVPAGFPADLLDHIRALGDTPIEAAESTEICPGARTTGTLGRGAIEEHGLCVNTADGWMLVTGCAHPGIHKMADRVHELTGGPIHMILGGFHMGDKPESTVKGIVRRLQELGAHRVAPCHCSGDGTRKTFKDELGDRCDLPGVGHVFSFAPVGPDGSG